MKDINAYRAADTSPAGLMQVERDALLRAARALEVSVDGPARVRFEALHANNQLWTALAFDCASDANQLSESLRAKIISLSMWVLGHSAKVLRGKADVAPLCEVNRNVAAGVAAAIDAFHSRAGGASVGGGAVSGADIIG